MWWWCPICWLVVETGLSSGWSRSDFGMIRGRSVPHRQPGGRSTYAVPTSRGYVLTVLVFCFCISYMLIFIQSIGTRFLSAITCQDPCINIRSGRIQITCQDPCQVQRICVVLFRANFCGPIWRIFHGFSRISASGGPKWTETKIKKNRENNKKHKCLNLF